MRAMEKLFTLFDATMEETLLATAHFRPISV